MMKMNVRMLGFPLQKHCFVCVSRATFLKSEKFKKSLQNERKSTKHETNKKRNQKADNQLQWGKYTHHVNIHWCTSYSKWMFIHYFELESKLVVRS